MSSRINMLLWKLGRIPDDIFHLLARTKAFWWYYEHCWLPVKFFGRRIASPFRRETEWVRVGPPRCPRCRTNHPRNMLCPIQIRITR